MKNLAKILGYSVMGISASAIIGIIGYCFGVENQKTKYWEIENEKEKKEAENYYKNPEILKGVVESKGDFMEEAHGFKPIESFDYFFVRSNSGTDSAKTHMVIAYKNWNIDSLINNRDNLELTIQHWQKKGTDIIVYPSGWYDTPVKINGKKIRRGCYKADGSITGK